MSVTKEGQTQCRARTEDDAESICGKYLMLQRQAAALSSEICISETQTVVHIYENSVLYFDAETEEMSWKSSDESVYGVAGCIWRNSMNDGL